MQRGFGLGLKCTVLCLSGIYLCLCLNASPGGEASGSPRAEPVHAAPHTGLLGAGRAGPSTRPRDPPRDDPEEEEDAPTQQEEEMMLGR